MINKISSLLTIKWVGSGWIVDIKIEIKEENQHKMLEGRSEERFEWNALFPSCIKDSKWVYLSVGGGGVVYGIAVARCSAGRLERQS